MQIERNATMCGRAGLCAAASMRGVQSALPAEAMRALEQAMVQAMHSLTQVLKQHLSALQTMCSTSMGMPQPGQPEGLDQLGGFGQPGLQHGIFSGDAVQLGQLLTQAARLLSGGSPSVGGAAAATTRISEPVDPHTTQGPARAANEAKADDGTRIPRPDDIRPPNDKRNAEQIVADHPTLRGLGHQKDIKRGELRKQVGNWENDPDPKKRADAAYRACAVLDYIKSSKDRDGGDRGDVTRNGKIEGITKNGDARRGTEAGLLKDFAEKGYSALPKDHRLDPTNDKHVRKNGTNMDNFEYGMRLVGSTIAGALSKAFSVLSNIVGATLGRIPGIGKLLAAPAEAIATGLSGAFNVAKTAADGGDVKKAGRDAGLDMAQQVVESGAGIVDPTGIGAGMAGAAFRSAVDKDAPKFDPKQAPLGALNPLS